MIIKYANQPYEKPFAVWADGYIPSEESLKGMRIEGNVDGMKRDKLFPLLAYSNFPIRPSRILYLKHNGGVADEWAPFQELGSEFAREGKRGDDYRGLMFLFENGHYSETGLEDIAKSLNAIQLRLKKKTQYLNPEAFERDCKELMGLVLHPQCNALCEVMFSEDYRIPEPPDEIFYAG